MIPCFPANNDTDAHHCDTVSNRSGQLQTIYSTIWKIRKDIIRKVMIRGNAHAAVHLRMINQFLKLVFILQIIANILFSI